MRSTKFPFDGVYKTVGKKTDKHEFWRVSESVTMTSARYASASEKRIFDSEYQRWNE